MTCTCETYGQCWACKRSVLFSICKRSQQLRHLVAQVPYHYIGRNPITARKPGLRCVVQQRTKTPRNHKVIPPSSAIQNPVR